MQPGKYRLATASDGSRAYRAGNLEIVLRRAMPALCTARADDLKHFFLGGLGSASEAHCPARLGPGGAFLLLAASLGRV
jgi:hypothetical protein